MEHWYSLANSPDLPAHIAARPSQDLDFSSPKDVVIRNGFRYNQPKVKIRLIARSMKGKPGPQVKLALPKGAMYKEEASPNKEIIRSGLMT